MTLEFREYKKKIKKNIFLELDFKVSTGEILTIISNNTLELDSLKDSFKRRTKFKGEITFDNIDINEEKLKDVTILPSRIIERGSVATFKKK